MSQVVASIHQPNSQITEGFDDLLLLHGGQTSYFGPWQTSMAYFDSVNYPCPMYTNPSDHYLQIMKESGDYLTKIWAESAIAKSNLSEGLHSTPTTPGMFAPWIGAELLIKLEHKAWLAWLDHSAFFIENDAISGLMNDQVLICLILIC